MLGKVASSRGSFGFITPADPTIEDIFYHKSELRNGRKRLTPDEIVEFDIGERNGMPVAKNIRVIVPVPAVIRPAAATAKVGV